MNTLRAALSEIVGLFVDDWAFALGLVAWVGAMDAARHWQPQGALVPTLLFGGLAALLLVFVVRKARSLHGAPPRQ